MHLCLNIKLYHKKGFIFMVISTDEKYGIFISIGNIFLLKLMIEALLDINYLKMYNYPLVFCKHHKYFSFRVG